MKKIEIPKIKSPLRYPGGKSRALKQILPILPDFDEFREPMVGGGSVFFAAKQLVPTAKFWINDLNKELYLFWKFCKEDCRKVVAEIEKIKKNSKDGKKLYVSLLDTKNLDEFQRAVRFFILNRITFSGLSESGGYAPMAYSSRFTDSSIERLEEASEVLQNTKITNDDYEKLLNEDGSNVFIFLDPPYLSKTKSRLYGKNGDLHEGFDHERFVNMIKKCKHKWLITYDDSKEVRELFAEEIKSGKIFLYKWELQYGMNNYKQKTAAKGDELFISNFEIPSLEKNKI